MLSRVAENIYWVARYIERVENTARIINVNSHLLMDLPPGIVPGWKPLIDITGSEALFLKHYKNFDERNVVKYLVGDNRNSSSIISSLTYARENARTIRDVVLREIWEEINELHHFAQDDLNDGLSKKGRYAYLKRIIRSAHTVSGLITGCMNHDASYEFIRLGRFIERADMTTRIIEVRAGSLLSEEKALKPFANIQWMSVLKSLTAYQMYRLKMHARVNRFDVLKFLLKDPDFPRSFYYCVNEAAVALSRLPRHEDALRIAARIKRTVQSEEFSDIARSDLIVHMDQLQRSLGKLHEGIAQTYFLPEISAEPT